MLFKKRRWLIIILRNRKNISVNNKHLFFIFIAIFAVFNGCKPNSDTKLVQIFHQPECFTRRYGDFTANICGSLASNASKVTYQINNGRWMELRQGGPRVPPPLFTIELCAEELRSGTNNLTIKAFSNKHEPEVTSLQFEYDPQPVNLPILEDWSKNDLDVQDGYWERFSVNNTWRVRPKPGFEDYDRVLAVTGAFSDGRRIETDMVFRSFKRKASDGPGFQKNLLNLTNDVPYGFGILPMWGGRPDSQGITPRRGWNFCIAWFYSRYKGVGMEFSYKQGDLSPKWISTYRNFNVEENRKYFLNVECWPEREETGRHVLYRQRMKWWAEGESEPDNWMELDDIAGSTLPDGEYAVALVAHRSQVDFGPVTVKPIKQ